MSKTPRILAFSGSLQEKSFNKKILEVAIDGVVHSQASLTYLDLKDYPLPLYDQELEDKEGLPENVKVIKDMMRNHDAFLIASPEHNGSFTAALKNMIDWTSRKETPEEPMLDCFRGKVAAIMSASPGALGGLRGLMQLRSFLEGIQVLVLPTQLTLPIAFNAFDEDGKLKDASIKEGFFNLGSHLCETVRKLKAD